MRLDKYNCFGGRINDKNISGIKMNGNVLYPRDYSLYNRYKLNVEAIDGYFIDTVDFRPLSDAIPNYECEYFYDFGNGKIIKQDYLLSSYRYPEAGKYTLVTSELIIGNLTYDFVEEVEYVSTNIKDAASLFCDFNHMKYFSLDSSYKYKVDSVDHMFWDCTNLEYVNLTNWDVSNVISFWGLFQNCGKLRTVDLTGWDVNNAYAMDYMFGDCFELREVRGIEDLYTSNIKNTSNMFYNCMYLSELDLSGMCPQNNVTAKEMFYGCAFLTHLNLSNFKTAFGYVDLTDMFYGCEMLYELRLDNCDTTTIRSLIQLLPTNDLEPVYGLTRKIYCKRANADELTPPENWVFEYVD